MQRDLIAAKSKEVTLWQTIKAAFSSNTMQDYSKENSSEATKLIDEQITKIKEKVNEMNVAKESINEVMNAEKNADNILGDSISALETKMNLYTTAIKNAKSGSEEFIRIKSKMIEVDNELQKQNDKNANQTKENVKKQIS